MKRNRVYRLGAVAVLVAFLTLGALWKTGKVSASDPPLDPPAFAPVGITPSETMRLVVSCDHIQVGEYPPNPCRGSLHFMDVAGNILKEARYSLNPGESSYLDLDASEVNFGRANRVEIDPCFIPAEGRGLPAVEMIDASTGKTDLYVNPVTPRLSFIKDMRGTAE
jgi:hypothetical protein